MPVILALGAEFQVSLHYREDLISNKQNLKKKDIMRRLCLENILVENRKGTKPH